MECFIISRLNDQILAKCKDYNEARDQLCKIYKNDPQLTIVDREAYDILKLRKS